MARVMLSDGSINESNKIKILSPINRWNTVNRYGCGVPYFRV